MVSPEFLGRCAGLYFTGFSVKSLMVNPLTGSLREKRRTFRPLTSETSTGPVLSHMPTVNGSAMTVGSLAPLTATSRCCFQLGVTTRAVSA